MIKKNLPLPALSASAFSKTAIWLVLLVLLTQLGGCTAFFKAMKYGKPDYSEYNSSPTAPIPASSHPSALNPVASQISLPEPGSWTTKLPARLQGLTADQLFEKTGTIAILVLRNDSLVYEKYYNGHTRETPALSFSVGKSIVSTLAAMSMYQGQLQFDQPVYAAMPGVTSAERSGITVNHCLYMQSGLNHNDYKTIGKLTSIFYGNRLDRLVQRARQKDKPGKRFVYKTLDTQILGMCMVSLEGLPFIQMMQQRLWEPLGMQYDAQWMLDRPGGIFRYGGGLASSVTDILRFGRFILNGGSINGQQMLPDGWLKQVAARDTSDGRWYGYALGWWTHFDGQNLLLRQDGDFAALGFGGQVLYIDPASNTVVLRAGKNADGLAWGTMMKDMAASINQKQPAYPAATEVPATLPGTYTATAGEAIHCTLRIEALTGGAIKVSGGPAYANGTYTPRPDKVWQHTGRNESYIAVSADGSQLLLENWSKSTWLRKN